MTVICFLAYWKHILCLHFIFSMVLKYFLPLRNFENLVPATQYFYPFFQCMIGWNWHKRAGPWNFIENKFLKKIFFDNIVLNFLQIMVKNCKICWRNDFGRFVPEKFSRLRRDSSYTTNQNAKNQPHSFCPYKTGNYFK